MFDFLFTLYALAYAKSAYAIAAIQPASSQSLPGSSFKLTGDSTLTINNLTRSATDVIGIVAGALAVIYILWYGVQYILSGGSADKTKAARQGIINGVIGIAIITAAYAFIRFAVAIGERAAQVVR
jgi:hypothetical protein